MTQQNGQHDDASDDDKLVPTEVKRVLIEQELQMWRNTRYQNQLRFRVQKSLARFSDTAEIVKGLETELTRCEAAIGELELILKELGLEEVPQVSKQEA